LGVAEAASDPSAAPARAAHSALERQLGALDEALGHAVGARGRPEPIDAAFLAWLAEALEQAASGSTAQSDILT
jgi:hypothetical protein